MAEITRIFCAVRYGSRDISEEERVKVETALRLLRAYRPPARRRA